MSSAKPGIELFKNDTNIFDSENFSKSCDISFRRAWRLEEPYLGWIVITMSRERFSEEQKPKSNVYIDIECQTTSIFLLLLVN